MLQDTQKQKNMNKLIFFAVLLVVAFSQSMLAQSENEANDENKVNKTCELKVERMVFPIYPISAVADGIRGDVIVEIEISKEGKVVGTKMLTGHELLQPVVERAVSE